MGHCNKADILSLQNVVDGMKIECRNIDTCETCILGKTVQCFNREPGARAISPSEFVHVDLCGPIDPLARGNFKYTLAFVDDFSNTMFIYFLKYKSETVKGLQKFLADSSQYGKVKRMRTDNGGEFLSHEYESILIDNKIKHETSAPKWDC